MLLLLWLPEKQSHRSQQSIAVSMALRNALLTAVEVPGPFAGIPRRQQYHGGFLNAKIISVQVDAIDFRCITLGDWLMTSPRSNFCSLL